MLMVCCQLFFVCFCRNNQFSKTGVVGAESEGEESNYQQNGQDLKKCEVAWSYFALKWIR